MYENENQSTMHPQKKWGNKPNNIDNLIIQWCKPTRLATEIRMMLKIENFFSPELCGYAFLTEIRNLQNNASISTIHIQQNPITEISVKSEVAKYA